MRQSLFCNIIYNTSAILKKKSRIKSENVLKFDTQLVSQFSVELDYFYMKLRKSPCSTLKQHDLIKKLTENNILYKLIAILRSDI